LKSIAPPVITLDRPEVCPNGVASASVPAEYSDYHWSVSNATIISPDNGPVVQFRASGAGPVEVGVWVRSDESCEAMSAATIPHKSIPPPEIAVDRPEICPTGTGHAAIVTPYYTVTDYHWTITNGTI